MIQVLFYVLVVQTALILLLLLKNPFKKFGLMGLDRVKRGRGPTIVKTIAATVFIVMCSSIYSIAEIQKRSFDAGSLSPTDEVLLGKNLLEVSFMGFVLLLAFIIDRAHHYLRELRALRKNAEAAKKEKRGLKDGKSGSSDELKELEDENTSLRLKIKQLESEGSKNELSALKEKIKHLESELETKDKEVNAAETSAMALKKQSDGLLLEYDRLLEENQSLRSQLQSMDWNMSYSDGKKNT
ncbi:hypothetical protein H6P81_013727 [Aristolochia fimbriata]|uniref:Endoplasmic reticulum transmembrane protein n=1 Tax=Aristolochia fimbriata TaxID=158543 RepID=A0AAV7EFZ9_ARIFI|nr:hypothetical protein H6P81_013727 [Aristolochia fimbriata]